MRIITKNAFRRLMWLSSNMKMWKIPRQPTCTIPCCYRFQVLLTLFPKFFSCFPHGTCMLSIMQNYWALKGIYLSFRLNFQAIRLLETTPYEANSRSRTRLSLVSVLLPNKLLPWTHSGDSSTNHNSPSKRRRFHVWTFPNSLAVTTGILFSFFSSAYLYA